MAELLDTSIVHVAEEIAQKIGLVLPIGNENIKVAGNLLAFEAIKSVTEIIYPAALSSMSFNANGITLAFIQKKLDEINEKIDTLMNVQHKSAKDILKRAINSLRHQNYEDAYDEFKKVLEKATDAYNSVKDNDIKRIECTNIKTFSIVMTKSYNKELKYFVPYESLKIEKKEEIASLVKIEADQLLNDVKNVKKRPNVTRYLKAVTSSGEYEKVFDQLYNFLLAGKHITVC